MKNPCIPPSKSLLDSIFKYLEMSQKKKVLFDEKTEIIELVNYFVFQDELTTASEVLHEGIRQFPCSAELHLKRAELWLLLDKPQRALASAERASAFSPGNYQIEMTKVQILNELRQLDEAREVLLAVLPLENAEQEAEVYFQLACLAQRNGLDFEEMFLMLSYSFSRNPNNEEAVRLLEFCIEMHENFAEGEALFQSVIDEHPYAELAWMGLGNIYAAQNLHTKAEEAYEYAYLVNPDNVQAYKSRAEQLLRAEDYRSALDCLEEIEYPDQSILLLFGRSHALAGDYAKAIEYCLAASALDSENHEIQYHIGCCHLKLNQFQEAAEYFRQAIGIDTDNEIYQSALGEACSGLGDIESALDCFMLATGLAPDEQGYWIKLAIALMQTEDYEGTLEQLDEAENHVPETIALSYCRIACLYKMGRRDEGRWCLGEALSQHFDKCHLLFEYYPLLRQDAEVVSTIAKYA